MARVSIITTEAWPVFYTAPPTKDDPDAMDMDDEVLARYKRIQDEYDAMQDELCKLSGYRP